MKKTEVKKTPPLPVAPPDGAVYHLPTGEKWLYRTDAGGWCQVLKRTLGVREYLSYPQQEVTTL
mgnify:CR=1 FL=1